MPIKLLNQQPKKYFKIPYIPWNWSNSLIINPLRTFDTSSLHGFYLRIHPCHFLVQGMIHMQCSTKLPRWPVNHDSQSVIDPINVSCWLMQPAYTMSVVRSSQTVRAWVRYSFFLNPSIFFLGVLLLFLFLV